MGSFIKMDFITVRIRQHIDRIRDVSLAVIGILLFAIFIHGNWPIRVIAFAGLAVTAILIGFSIRQESLLCSFGLSGISRKMLFYTIPAIITGVVLGMLTRRTFNLVLLPGPITRVACIAPLVGITEELIFRGYIQGHLKPIGRVFSILYASTVHTAYKLLVILSLSLPLQFNFFFLVALTFIVGILFGILRELSNSAIPPSLAHAVFDVVLYGGFVLAPVWVWS